MLDIMLPTKKVVGLIRSSRKFSCIIVATQLKCLLECKSTRMAIAIHVPRHLTIVKLTIVISQLTIRQQSNNQSVAEQGHRECLCSFKPRTPKDSTLISNRSTKSSPPHPSK